MPKIMLGKTEKTITTIVVVTLILAFSIYLGERFQPYKIVKNIAGYTVHQLAVADTQKTITTNTKVQKTKSSKYTVKNGDTIWSISKKFHVNQVALKFANYIGSDNHLTPGQKLVIPKKMM